MDAVIRSKSSGIATLRSKTTGDAIMPGLILLLIYITNDAGVRTTNDAETKLVVIL